MSQSRTTAAEAPLRDLPARIGNQIATAFSQEARAAWNGRAHFDMIVRGRKIFAFAGAAGSLAGACGLVLAFALLPTAALAAAGRVTIVSEGVPRTAILVQHRRLKQARRSAVLILRGGREKGARLRRTFGFEEMARSSGAILIYPEPLSGHWEDAPEASRDLVFIHDLIAKLAARGIADRGKVFLVGIAAGGPMAWRLACDGKNAFAGVAVLGASSPSGLEASCKPSRPIPLMMIAGTAISSPHGNTEHPAIDATLGLFGKAARCAGGMTTTVLPEKYTHDDDTRAYLDRLNHCAVPVEAVRIEGGGHALAGRGSEAGPGHGLTEVNSAKLVWDFFRRLGG